eukprot:14983727-Alexandrium_andersonii.AAC.1
MTAASGQMHRALRDREHALFFATWSAAYERGLCKAAGVAPPPSPQRGHPRFEDRMPPWARPVDSQARKGETGVATDMPPVSGELLIVQR